MRYELEESFFYHQEDGMGGEFCSFDTSLLSSPSFFELTPEQAKFLILIHAMCCDGDRTFSSRNAAFCLRMPVAQFERVCSELECICEVNED